MLLVFEEFVFFVLEFQEIMEKLIWLVFERCMSQEGEFEEENFQEENFELEEEEEEEVEGMESLQKEDEMMDEVVGDLVEKFFFIFVLFEIVLEVEISRILLGESIKVVGKGWNNY